MKVFAAILILMLTAQPAPAGFCDMHASGEMNGHAGMQHDLAGSMAGHDCCDAGAPADFDIDCPDQCGSCAHGAAVVLSLALIRVAPPAAVPAVHQSDALASSYATHPYRPPRPVS